MRSFVVRQGSDRKSSGVRFSYAGSVGYRGSRSCFVQGGPPVHRARGILHAGLVKAREYELALCCRAQLNHFTHSLGRDIEQQGEHHRARNRVAAGKKRIRPEGLHRLFLAALPERSQLGSSHKIRSGSPAHSGQAPVLGVLRSGALPGSTGKRGGGSYCGHRGRKLQPISRREDGSLGFFRVCFRPRGCGVPVFRRGTMGA